MIEIQSLSVLHKSKKYIVHPRVELITDCMSNKRGIYEALCLVMNDDTQTCPKQFFDELSSRETYMIYRHTLDDLKAQTAATILLNVNINFLESKYVELLLSEFGSDNIIWELVESSHLHSIIHIRDRLSEIRKNPRVRIWLDDFGTARANFDVVNVINFDGIKMSKNLFWDLYENDQTLLKHMIKMMKRKSDKVIIGGVDNFDKYVFCKTQQCLMQGYFFDEIKNSAVS
ncbi:EAL domain-containing protein [Psychromonas sp.]|uniref:EAL domain-containing protein n=1 Tax=Psychromonas sp. TaxID=1884585 RepID=UPI0039E28C1E